MSAGKIGEVEQRSGDRADGLASRSTLTVIDNRTGERSELPIERRRGPQLGARTAGGWARAIRPGAFEHGRVSQRDHAHRWGGRDPPAPRLPDRGAVRALELPRAGVSADQRGVADRRGSTSRGCTRSGPATSSTRTSRASSRDSGMTRARSRWWPRRSVRSPASIPTPTRCTTRRPGSCRWFACWRSCRPWRPSPTATCRGCRTCTPRITSATRGTCCR